MRYEFEWDPGKAKQNAEKHRVTFDQATGVFRDPRAISIYDPKHGQDEDRWVTLGICSTGALLAVHHTYVQAGRHDCYPHHFQPQSDQTRTRSIHGLIP